MKKNRKSIVYLGAVIYSIITGLSFLFGKVALSHSDPLDLLAYRFTAAFLGALVPVIFGWIKIDISWKMIKKVLPISIFNPILFFGLQSYGLELLQSSEAGIFLALIPIFTMVLASQFLNEKTSRLQKLSIIVSVAGVIYIAIKKGSSFEFSNIKGMAFLLISVLSFAIYSVMARKMTRDFSSISLSYLMIGISFLSFNLLAIGKNLINGSMGQFIGHAGEFEFIMAVLYLGVLSTFITVLISNFVLSKLEAYKMSVFTNLATVISIVAGVVVLNEDIYYYHIIGSILIIAGVIGANFFGIKEDKEVT